MYAFAGGARSFFAAAARAGREARSGHRGGVLFNGVL